MSRISNAEHRALIVPTHPGCCSGLKREEAHQLGANWNFDSFLITW